MSVLGSIVVYHVSLALHVYMDAMMKEVKIRMGRGVRFQEKGREWRFPGLLYADDSVLFESGRPESNGGTMQMIVSGGEEGLECEICVDRIHLEHVSEFKYLVCVLDESGTNETECSIGKIGNHRKVGVKIKWCVLAQPFLFPTRK